MKFDFLMSNSLVVPINLMSGPLEVQFRRLRWLIINVLYSSPESKRIKAESSLSPIQDIFSASK